LRKGISVTAAGPGADAARRRVHPPCLVLLLLLALAPAARAELIDRIAVSVGNRVITESDLQRQIRVIAFQNGDKPDFSAANKHAVAEKMIDQKLIERELENARYPMPDAADLAPAIAEFKKTHYPDEAAFQRALAEYHINEQDLLDVLLWERTLLEFIQIRFESGVLVSEQEVADYAKQHKLDTSDAEHALISGRADQQLEIWLRDARNRTPVIVHEEALR